MRPPDFRCLPEAGVRPIPDLESCARTSEAVPLGTHVRTNLIALTPRQSHIAGTQ